MGSPVHGIARLRDLVLGLKPANLIPNLGAYGLGRDAGEDPGEHGAFLIIDGSVFERESLEHGEFPGIDRIIVPEYGEERVLHDGVRVRGLFHRSRFPSGWRRSPAREPKDVSRIALRFGKRCAGGQADGRVLLTRPFG
jgi:hypothetical protein